MIIESLTLNSSIDAFRKSQEYCAYIQQQDWLVQRLFTDENESLESVFSLSITLHFDIYSMCVGCQNAACHHQCVPANMKSNNRKLVRKCGGGSGDIEWQISLLIEFN